MGASDYIELDRLEHCIRDSGEACIYLHEGSFFLLMEGVEGYDKHVSL